jgi:hypothetical protein
LFRCLRIPVGTDKSKWLGHQPSCGKRAFFVVFFDLNFTVAWYPACKQRLTKTKFVIQVKAMVKTIPPADSFGSVTAG